MAAFCLDPWSSTKWIRKIEKSFIQCGLMKFSLIKENFFISLLCATLNWRPDAHPVLSEDGLEAPYATQP
ncbi:hypothetical protein RSK20926_13694 [Roseobacter sp. SK209-2-6]|nr:hypothetical protein RSK20926_13694 [Roseobacter sp. SK209-2-6]